MAADSLVARRRVMPDGGSAWRSSIQAPHHHTDRDVGAASIGAGPPCRLRGHARPRLPSCCAGGGRLPARRGRAGGEAGCAGPTGPIRTDAGPTRISRASTTARPGSATTSGRCTTSRTSRVSAPARSPVCAGWSRRPRAGPAPRPRAPGAGRTIRPGAWSTTASAWARRASCSLLDTFADRTNDSTFRAYARAGAAQLRALTANGARPLPRSSDERATHETGFLSGSAGAAYMFLERYRRDHDPVDLATARRLLAWVDDQRWSTRRGRSAGRSPETRTPGRPRASSSESRGSHG